MSEDPLIDKGPKITRRDFLKMAVVGTGSVALGKYLSDNSGLLAYKAVESAVESESLIDLFTKCATEAIVRKAKDHFSKDLGTTLEANSELQMVPNLIEEAVKLSEVPEITYHRDPRQKPAKYYWDKLTRGYVADYGKSNLEEAMTSITSTDFYLWLKGDPESKIDGVIDYLHSRGQELWTEQSYEGATQNEIDTDLQTASAPIFNWNMVGGIEGSGYYKRKGNPKALSEYTKQLVDVASDKNGVKSITRVLAAAIRENDGRLDLALWDATTAMKLMARNDLDTAEFIADKKPDVISKRFNGWTDSLSILGNGFMLQGRPDNADKDLSVVNKVGLNYHVLNTLALLSKYPREIVKLSVLGSQLYELKGQGLIKSASDLFVLQQLTYIDKFLDKYHF